MSFGVFGEKSEDRDPRIKKLVEQFPRSENAFPVTTENFSREMFEEGVGRLLKRGLHPSQIVRAVEGFSDHAEPHVARQLIAARVEHVGWILDELQRRVNDGEMSSDAASEYRKNIGLVAVDQMVRDLGL